MAIPKVIRKKKEEDLLALSNNVVSAENLPKPVTEKVGLEEGVSFGAIAVGILIAVGLLVVNVVPGLNVAILGLSVAGLIFQSAILGVMLKKDSHKPTLGNTLGLMGTAVSVSLGIMSLIFPALALPLGIVTAGFLLGTSGVNLTHQLRNLINKPASETGKTRSRVIKVVTGITIAALAIGSFFVAPLAIAVGIVACIGAAALVVNKIFTKQQAAMPGVTKSQSMPTAAVEKSATNDKKAAVTPEEKVRKDDIYKYHQTRREMHARDNWFLRDTSPKTKNELPNSAILKTLPGYRGHESHGQKPWDYVLVKLDKDNALQIYRNEIVANQLNSTTFEACTYLVKAMCWDKFDLNKVVLEKSLGANQQDVHYMESLNTLKSLNKSTEAWQPNPSKKLAK